MNFKISNRVSNLPSYLFAHLENMKQKRVKEGYPVIDLSVGDPSFPTQSHIVEKMKEVLSEYETHRYPPFRGIDQLKITISEWYKRRFGVDIDPEKEVLILVGSKEGLSHISLSYIDPGEIALVPNPGYPAYAGGVALAGGEVEEIPLLEKNNFFPDFSNVSPRVAKKAKLMFLNYPNNPTGAVASVEDFERAVEFAKKNNIIVAHDAAYSEVSFGNYVAPSFLKAKGAKEIGVEFHSFSKTFCMTGWRIGMVVGNAEVIDNIAKTKAFVDSGVFGAIQKAASFALDSYNEVPKEIKERYLERMNILKRGLEPLGWEIQVPKAGYFIWVKVPNNNSSMEFCKMLLEKAGVLMTPGVGFGGYGEGFIRISLNVEEEQLHRAIKSINENIYIQK
ncbi:aminotransferase class I/II-fold pyridoxal phosphate-dependent enzyme [Bacillus cereus]|uniref:LL-diaminopimelate aminotransferase n=1 Tax=Bacillus cereus TaxID=1396 RepID=UPI0018796593|nr:LL-diaminopimelate aminotransferase [Bacillus cereus]MBE7105787.1 aminotransferase class I/II-fold pyridoxal phosphate-dependent enzyme [Bacillus cereus]